MNISRNILVVVAFLVSLLVIPMIGISDLAARSVDIRELPDFDYVTLGLDALDMDGIEEYVNTFSSFGTRFTGSSGCDEAANFIFDEFSSIGLENVSYHYFNVVVPCDEGAYLTLPSGENVTLYPFLPNVVSASQTPPGGISGNLIYVGEGNVEDYDGKKIDGSIVLMDLNSQYRWLMAAKYGAKAVIFIEPSDTSIQENKMKILSYVPYLFPRLYAKAEDAGRLVQNEGATVKLVSNMKIRQVVSRNVIGYLPGSVYADRYVLLTASYDSYSYVPSLAPGAREAIGISAVLQLARYFATHPDSHKYTLVFIAFSGTNQGVVGSRWFVKEYVDEKWDTWGRKLALQMNFDIDDVNSFLMPTLPLGWCKDWHETVAPWVYDYNDWLFNTIRPDLAERLAMPELDYDPRVRLVDARIVRDMFGAGGPGHGIVWQDQCGSPYRFADSEPLLNLGGPGFTWYNYLSFEKYTYTAFDLPEKIYWGNVEYKFKAFYPIVYATVNVDLSELIGHWVPAYAVGPYPKWTDIVGEIAQYNVTKGWYEPIPNALFMFRKLPSSSRLQPWQDFPWTYSMSDEDGKIFEPGLQQNLRMDAYDVRAFKLN